MTLKYTFVSETINWSQRRMMVALDACPLRLVLQFKLWFFPYMSLIIPKNNKLFERVIVLPSEWQERSEKSLNVRLAEIKKSPTMYQMSTMVGTKISTSVNHGWCSALKDIIGHGWWCCVKSDFCFCCKFTEDCKFPCNYCMFKSLKHVANNSKIAIMARTLATL